MSDSDWRIINRDGPACNALPRFRLLPKRNSAHETGSSPSSRFALAACQSQPHYQPRAAAIAGTVRAAAALYRCANAAASSAPAVRPPTPSYGGGTAVHSPRKMPENT